VHIALMDSVADFFVHTFILESLFSALLPK
jgi:hypothetical protein